MYYKLAEDVKRVTAADVQRVAKKYFTEDQRSTGWYVPREDKSAEPSGEKTSESASDKNAAEEQSPTSDHNADKGKSASEGTAKPHSTPPAAKSKSMPTSAAARCIDRTPYYSNESRWN